MADATSERRHDLLVNYLQHQVAHIFGSDLSQIPDADRGFFDLGMDSLMVVEFKTNLERTFNRPLPATLAFEVPTIQDLADYLIRELGYGVTAEPEEDGTPESELASLPLAIDLDGEIAQRIAKLEQLVGDHL